LEEEEVIVALLLLFFRQKLNRFDYTEDLRIRLVELLLLLRAAEELTIYPDKPDATERLLVSTDNLTVYNIQRKIAIAIKVLNELVMSPTASTCSLNGSRLKMKVPYPDATERLGQVSIANLRVCLLYPKKNSYCNQNVVCNRIGNVPYR
jgi:hypothetical protein